MKKNKLMRWNVGTEGGRGQGGNMTIRISCTLFKRKRKKRKENKEKEGKKRRKKRERREKKGKNGKKGREKRKEF